AVLHMDVAGTITAVADDVSSFRPGDQVYGCAGGLKTVAGENLGGALAEFMLADANLIAHKPGNLSLPEAAALPLVTITAWEGLHLRAGLQAGQRVLIHAGTGGVGHIALQLAKQAGAQVYTTVSSQAKANLARQLGADVVINYRTTAVADYVAKHTAGAGFDLVMDT
ncbi:MAG: zinc-binding dehydrogenase, partial [Candidatus Competibacteraceae bacterium]|nr:zinc-binding dehydrogenase [Candidatus Competibacteraceae bacterium]